MSEIDHFTDLVRSIYQTNEFIGLHEPRFSGNEIKYLTETIQSSYVSSIGKYVDTFEQRVAEYTGVEHAVSVVNGTAALQVGLSLAGVDKDTEVLTQALTFVATSNAITYNGANPVFLDVDYDTMGLSPTALDDFLDNHAELRGGTPFNKQTDKRIAAVLPMHTFGFMCRIDEILAIAKKWNIPVVEDAAEAFGSYYKGQHSGTFGVAGAFSFNGNKLITAGGGGALISTDSDYMKKAKHITTTAKKSHAWEYFHDQLGYNFRMPNLNAALVLAQFEKMEELINSKKGVYQAYVDGLGSSGYKIRSIPQDTTWNYWLISLEFEENAEREAFLEETNNKGVMTRPIWNLMYELPMYSDCFRDSQQNAMRLAKSIVNIPSSARI